MLTINLDSKLTVSSSINIQPTATKSLNFKELLNLQKSHNVFIDIFHFFNCYDLQKTFTRIVRPNNQSNIYYHFNDDKSLLQRISVPEHLLFFTPVLNNHKNIYLLKTKFKPIRLVLYQNKTLYFTEIYLNKIFNRVDYFGINFEIKNILMDYTRVFNSLIDAYKLAKQI